MIEFVTAEQLGAWSAGQVAVDDEAQLVVEAVNSYVSTLPVADRVSVVDGQPVVPDHVRLGCLLLANRTHRRRHSPHGIEAMTGESVAYVARYDPEISRYLELDRPRVG